MAHGHSTYDATADAPRENQNHWNTLSTLKDYLWPEGRFDLKTRVIVAMLFLALAKLINVYVPFLLKHSIDALSLPDKNMVLLPLGFILSYGLARLLHQGFGELRDFIFVKVAQHAQRAVGLKTFKHLHNLSLSFHIDRQTGGLSRVIERGTNGISFLLRFMLFNIIPTFLEIGMVTAILIYNFNMWFALVTFCTISAYIAFTLIVTEWRLKFRKQMNKKDSEANTKAIDSLLNYETVKYFCNEEHEYKRFDNALAGYEKAANRSQTSLSLLNIGQGIIVVFGLVSVLILAGKGVVAGELTVGDFVLVNSFMIQLYMPLNFLGFVYREIKQSLIDMDKMFELVKIHPQIQDKKDAVDLKVTKGEIKFENVCFSYHPDREIIKDISFCVSPGKTVAIVGPSGAGKSTISRLLFRFYDVTKGSVLVDGIDVRNLTQLSLRASIGVVPQDTVLFNDTVGYNIEYGKPGSDKTEIESAAKTAEIHDFIDRLPERYLTRVGERGLKLSGGEKQRVAIARTILKKPQILLFDEATSALDTHTEKEIQASLKKVSENRTTLVIAHRLSTIIHADEILVLDGGKIIERGRHDELLGLNGAYASMWAKQKEFSVS